MLIDRIVNIVDDAPCLSVEFSIMEHAGMPGPPPENRVRRQIARRTDFDRGRRREQGIGLRDGQAQDNGGDDHEGVAQAPSNHNRGKHGSGKPQCQFVEPIPMAPRQSAYEQASGAEDQQADNFGDLPGDGMYRGRRCRSPAFPVEVTRDSAIIAPKSLATRRA